MVETDSFKADPNVTGLLHCIVLPRPATSISWESTFLILNWTLEVCSTPVYWHGRPKRNINGFHLNLFLLFLCNFRVIEAGCSSTARESGCKLLRSDGSSLSSNATMSNRRNIGLWCTTTGCAKNRASNVVWNLDGGMFEILMARCCLKFWWRSKDASQERSWFEVTGTGWGQQGDGLLEILICQNF